MSHVVPTRLPNELARGVNALVKSGRYANRSEVIREATRLLLSSGGLPPPSSMVRIAERLVSALVDWNKLGVESVTLYGSVARGESGSQSDVDILVEFEPGHVPGFAFAGLQDELSQMIGRTVDLHTPGSLSRHFRERVLHEAQVRYAGATAA